MHRLFATAAIVAMTVTAAHAQPYPLQPMAPLPPSLRVAFGDLDLSRPGDAAILAGRIQSAARSVCQQISDGEKHIGQMRYVVQGQIQDCVDVSAQMAMAKVMRKMTDAVLTASRMASAGP